MICQLSEVQSTLKIAMIQLCPKFWMSIKQDLTDLRINIYILSSTIYTIMKNKHEKMPGPRHENQNIYPRHEIWNRYFSYCSWSQET